MSDAIARFEDEYPEDAKIIQELIRCKKGHLLNNLYVKSPSRNEPCPCGSGKNTKNVALRNNKNRGEEKWQEK